MPTFLSDGNRDNTDSLANSNNSDKLQQDNMYHDSCQEILSNIASVKSLIQDLNQSTEEETALYYPSESSVQVLKISQNDDTLLQQQLNDCIRHLNHLTTRVSNTSSKVLITGDLNSGKSTLVNALLKKDGKEEFLPVDQQPCTSIFCEVISTTEEEKDIIHAIHDISTYDKDNKDTYRTIELRHLYKLLTDEEREEEQRYKLLKIYTTLKEDKLLHNGVIDISLIDSPGLNTDSIQTISIFARQEEIDVVVFVVSAENHFTLSGKEFLLNAANERTHLFIVVNRFDGIRDKDRCKRLILEQIKQLSPNTYQQANDLVHFISSHHKEEASFIEMEEKLHSFVITNRTQSKLLPAKNYLTNLLRDIYCLSEINESKWMENVDKNVNILETNFLPGYFRMIKVQKSVEDELKSLVENTISQIEQQVSQSLQRATSEETLNELVETVEYSGLFSVWQYAQDMIDLLSSTLQDRLDKVETKAGQETVVCMNKMNSITYKQFVQGCSTEDVTTKVHDTANTSNSYRPMKIQVQVRDLLLNRRLVDDKKVALSGLGTLGVTTILFKVINFKDLALSIISRYINPLDDGSDSYIPSYQFMPYAITTVGILGIGWTAYSFISVIPQALRNNIKHKFQVAVENEKFTQNQTHRITQGVSNVLEAKQTEIVYRIKEIIEEKNQEKKTVEHDVFQAKLTLNHFKSLVHKSNTLLTKVQEQSLLVV
jgi:mitofusin